MAKLTKKRSRSKKNKKEIVYLEIGKGGGPGGPLHKELDKRKQAGNWLFVWCISIIAMIAFCLVQADKRNRIDLINLDKMTDAGYVVLYPTPIVTPTAEVIHLTSNHKKRKIKHWRAKRVPIKKEPCK